MLFSRSYSHNFSELAGPDDALVVPVPTSQPDTEPATPTTAEDVRTFFPESWIFQLARAE